MHEDGFTRRYAEIRPRAALLSSRGARAVARSLALRAAGTFRAMPATTPLRCHYLHYVYDDQVSAFRTLLRRLSDRFRFVPTQAVLEAIRGDAPTGRTAHLSFDDGFDNVYRNAFPVLLELRIPCITFLPSSLVGASDEIIRDAWWATYTRRPTRLLTWKQAREMADAGHEFGSHTASHARLSQLSGDRKRLYDEIVGSKKRIEDELSRPCRFLAWPFGTPRDIDDASREMIRAAGYEGCFSAVRGHVSPGRTDPLSIPRHHFEPQWPWSHVRYFAAGGGEAG